MGVRRALETESSSTRKSSGDAPEFHLDTNTDLRMRFLHGNRFWQSFKKVTEASGDLGSSNGIRTLHTLSLKLRSIGSTNKRSLPPLKASTNAENYVIAAQKESEMERVKIEKETTILEGVQPWNKEIKDMLFELPLKNFDILGYVRTGLRRLKLG